MRFGAGIIAGLCNGSTPDSDSVCEGSNPSPAAKCENPTFFKNAGFFFIFKAFTKVYRLDTRTSLPVLCARSGSCPDR